jgi:hypothetical protein
LFCGLNAITQAENYSPCLAHDGMTGVEPGNRVTGWLGTGSFFRVPRSPYRSLSSTESPAEFSAHPFLHYLNLLGFPYLRPSVVADFTRLLSFMATGGRELMSKKAAEHHHKAAEHHEHAARHHKEAAKHHEAGKHETAAHHAHLARGHHEHAMHHAGEAAKAHIEDHGKAIPAHA